MGLFFWSFLTLSRTFVPNFRFILFFAGSGGNLAKFPSTNSRYGNRSFCTFTPHAEEVVHAITRLKIEFHVFTPQYIPNHAERKIPWRAPKRALHIVYKNENLIFVELLEKIIWSEFTIKISKF